ncbi:hypothetical protein VP01_11063g1, partial [Puccinia sorghi]
KGKKFHPKGEEGLLVGFDPTLLSYRILTSAGSIIKSKHVQFLKKPESLVIASNSDDASEEIKFANEQPSSAERQERHEVLGCESLDCEENELNNAITEDNQSNDSDEEIQNNLVDQNPSSSPEPPPTRKLQDRSTLRPPERYGFHHYYKPRTIESALR